jgi:hypothetical protein
MDAGDLPPRRVPRIKIAQPSTRGRSWHDTKVGGAFRCSSQARCSRRRFRRGGGHGSLQAFHLADYRFHLVVSQAPIFFLSSRGVVAPHNGFRTIESLAVKDPSSRRPGPSTDEELRNPDTPDEAGCEDLFWRRMTRRRMIGSVSLFTLGGIVPSLFRPTAAGAASTAVTYDLVATTAAYLRERAISGPFYFYRGSQPVSTIFTSDTRDHAFSGFAQEMPLPNSRPVGFFALRTALEARPPLRSGGLEVALYPDAESVIEFYPGEGLGNVEIEASVRHAGSLGRGSIHVTLEVANTSDLPRATPAVGGRTTPTKPWSGRLQARLAKDDRLFLRLEKTAALQNTTSAWVELTIHAQRASRLGDSRRIS